MRVQFVQGVTSHLVWCTRSIVGDQVLAWEQLPRCAFDFLHFPRSHVARTPHCAYFSERRQAKI